MCILCSYNLVSLVQNLCSIYEKSVYIICLARISFIKVPSLNNAHHKYLSKSHSRNVHCKKRGVTEHPRGAIFYCFHGNSMGYHRNSKILLPWGGPIHRVFYSVVTRVYRPTKGRERACNSRTACIKGEMLNYIMTLYDVVYN